MITAADASFLPPLREELSIQQGAPLLSGAPSWVIYDPVRHRFFQIGQRAINMIALWSTGTREALKANMRAQWAIELEDEEIDGFISFLSANELVSGGNRGTAQGFARAGKIGLVDGLVRRHVFFKVPLVRPQGFLDATFPLMRPFFTRGFVFLTLIFLAVNFYLVGRLWSDVLEHVRAAFVPSGVGVFLVAVVFVKIIHELGHAYQAVLRGLKVPVMGVAFLVIFPLLYSDVTEVWRLKRRRGRMFVDAGGVLAELTLAVYATLLWCFLPDGMLRTAAFAVGTTSWVFSLLINLNPFLRFDGYYFLSDAIGFPNLQPRSFKYTRWAIRRTLFGLNDNPPEMFPPGRAAFVIIYAALTWIYRFFVFIGIALLVYNLFFKALGVVLFVAEMFYFFIRPLLAELREWTSMSDRIIRTRRTWLSISLLVVAIALLFVPFSSRVAVPALVERAAQQIVFPPEPAQIVEVLVVDGSAVSVGDPLFRFEDPELPARISDAEIRIGMLEARLLSGAGDVKERQDSGVTQRRLDEANQALSALRQLQESLLVTAPISGFVFELSNDARLGTWIERHHPLLRVVGGEKLVVRGLVSEANLIRIDPGRNADFVPENLQIERLSLGAVEISGFAVDQLPDRYFEAQYGGSIAVVPNEEGGLVPQQVWYPVHAEISGMTNRKSAPTKAERGRIFFRTKPESLVKRMSRRVAQVLIRELSF